MNQYLFLDKVIRKVDRQTRAYSNSERIVIIDKKSRQSIAKKPFFGGDLAFYLVFNDYDPNNFAERTNLICNIKTYSSNLEIKLNIDYRITCKSGNEIKLAESLHTTDSLENEMDKKIYNLIINFTRNNPEYFINSYTTQILELTEFIKRNIEENIGVYIDLKITLEQVEELETFSIPSIQFTVNLKDYENELKLSLETELITDELNKIKAVLNHGRELLLVNTITEEARKYLFQNTTLYQFCYELKDTVRDELIIHLNNTLRDYGRQIRYLSLDSNVEQLKPILIPIPSTQFPIFVKDCDEELRLSLGTELMVSDPKKALAHASQELFLVNKVTEEIRKFLFLNVSLQEFCYELKDSVRVEIINHLNKTLSDYGRQLRYLFLESDAEQRKPISIPIPSVQLAVLLNDCEKELNLLFETELVVNKLNENQAILNYGRESFLINKVQEEIKNYLLLNTSINSFCHELNSTVKDELINYLNKTLYDYGRQIKYLSLESDAEQLKPISIPIPLVQLSIFLKDYDDEIKLFLKTELIVNEVEKAILNYGQELFLENKIIEEVKNYLFHNATLHEFYYQLQGTIRDKLKNHLNKTLCDYGRQIKYLSLESDAEQLKPTPIPIPLTQFPIFVKDCDEELKLSLKTEIIVSDPIKAIVNHGQELFLENKIFEDVKNHLVKNITLHKFCYELKTKVRNELIETLNATLSNYGRQLSYLLLDSDSVTPGQELFNNRSYDVKCTVEGYPEAILVKSRLFMQPKDIGQYRLANSPNLEDWAEEKLKSIIQPLLLQTKYIDVLVKFESIAEKIKTKMEKAASQIGYEVTHLVSKPNLEPLKLLDSFNLENDDDTFSTKDARVKVKLSTFVTAKITDLEKIQKYLEQQADVQELMKNSIYNSTREYLTQIEPERFYMRFFQHDEQLGEKESVEQELSKKIKKKLEKKFAAKVDVVVPKPLDTEITKCYQELNSQIGFFEFNILSLKGGEPVTYRGDFQVLAVEENSWYIFQSRQPKINEVKLSIERNLNANLNSFDNEQLKYLDFNNLSELRDLINQLAKINVQDQFGLVISISNFSRTRTRLERSQAYTRTKLELADLKEVSASIDARRDKRQNMFNISSSKNQAQFEELKQLYKDRLAVSGNEGSVEEFQYINNRITDLEKEIQNPSLEDARTNLERLEQKKVKGISFREAAEQMNLPVSDSNTAPNPNETDQASDNEQDNNN